MALPLAHLTCGAAEADKLLLRHAPAFCPDCGIDVFTNPDAHVVQLHHATASIDRFVRIRCDCGGQLDIVLR